MDGLVCGHGEEGKRGERRDLRASGALGGAGGDGAGEELAVFSDAGILLGVLARRLRGCVDRGKGRWNGRLTSSPACGIATALMRPTAVARTKRMLEGYIVRVEGGWYESWRICDVEDVEDRDEDDDRDDGEESSGRRWRGVFVPLVFSTIPPTLLRRP